MIYNFVITKTMSSSADLKHHKLTKFFLAISIFITAISVLAVYSTTMGAEYSITEYSSSSYKIAIPAH
jgi:hypothetical protein